MALNLNKIIGRFALVLVALVVSGCTGMYLGEVANDENGAAELAEEKGVKYLHVSISHERDMAGAMVILEG